MTGEPDDARELIAGVLRSNGFTVDAAAGGGLAVQRGSATRTLLLGGLAGAATFMRFAVSFDDRGGSVVATLRRDVAAGVMRGGVIGAQRTSAVFDELARRVGVALAGPNQS